MPFDLYILYNPLAPLITWSKEDLSRQKSRAAFRLYPLLLFFSASSASSSYSSPLSPAVHFVFQAVKSFVLTKLDNVAIEPEKRSLITQGNGV